LKFPTQKQIDKTSRIIQREEWLTGAVRAVYDCNAVFLDPDNGLEIDSCSKTIKGVGV